MPIPLAVRAAAARLLGLWVRITPEAWMFVSCECCVLSGWGLCDVPITLHAERRSVWSRNLKKEQTMTRAGPQRRRRGKKTKHMDWIGYELDRQGFEFWEEQDMFLSSPKRPDRLWGRLGLPFNGYRDSFQGVKRPGREVSHSPPPSAEVRNERSYTFTSAIRLHGVDRENVLPRVLEELFKEFPTLYGTKGLLPCSQRPVTGLHPVSGELNPLYHVLGGNLSLKTIPSSSSSSQTLKVWIQNYHLYFAVN
jgi:hypothetical protein